MGIKPIWASEIESFPIKVTTKRMPEVKHLGDVSDIKGYEIEPVDIITFGSPCQDMYIAGKRAGLNGSRSNLFYEAIRIIKEMRVENFWGLCKVRLAKFRGVHRHTFYLHIKECEFRYNYRNQNLYLTLLKNFRDHPLKLS